MDHGRLFNIQKRVCVGPYVASLLGAAAMVMTAIADDQWWAAVVIAAGGRTMIAAAASIANTVGGRINGMFNSDMELVGEDGLAHHWLETLPE